MSAGCGDRSFLGEKFASSASMRCNTTVSLRASKTLALRMPARAARASSSSSGRALNWSGQNDVGCLVEGMRTLPSPILEMRPVTSASPD
jgi:hypothetical protein